MYFNKIAKFARKNILGLYYKYISKTTIYTVILRGRLDNKQASFVQCQTNFYGKSWKRVLASLGRAQVVLEIGFGEGSHLLAHAKLNPDKDYVGVELDELSIFKTLRKIDQEKLKNVSILNLDARTLLDQVPDNFFNKIYVLFPDPWPKRKDFKHRLLNLRFIKILVNKIDKSGEVVLGTDIGSYAEQIDNQLRQLQQENILNFEICKSNELENSVKFCTIHNTKFAQRAHKEGREITIFRVSKLMV